MKLFLLTILLNTVYGNTLTRESSWSEIEASYKVYPDFQKIVFDGSYFVPINNICQFQNETGTTMLSGGFFAECAEIDYEDKGRCRVIHKELIRGLNSQNSFCWDDKGNNCEQTIRSIQALKYEVPVLKNMHSEKILFIKTFEIPAC